MRLHRDEVEARLAMLNSLLAAKSSKLRYKLGGNNGYWCLEEHVCTPSTGGGNYGVLEFTSTTYTGSLREVHDFVRAMQIGIYSLSKCNTL